MATKIGADNFQLTNCQNTFNKLKYWPYLLNYKIVIQKDKKQTRKEINSLQLETD